jgi:hypothetical protein
LGGQQRSKRGAWRGGAVKREAAAAKRKVGMDIIKRRSAFLFLVLLGSGFWVFGISRAAALCVLFGPWIY